jgi:large subunit ribosomal protein L29
MRAEEIRELSDAEVEARIAELEEERFRLRFRGATEQLEDPLRLRFIRRDIARLRTIQREKAIAAGAPRKGRKNRRAAQAAGGAGAARGSAQGAAAKTAR